MLIDQGIQLHNSLTALRAARCISASLPNANRACLMAVVLSTVQWQNESLHMEQCVNWFPVSYCKMLQDFACGVSFSLGYVKQ